MVTGLAVSPDGMFLAAVTWGEQTHLFDLSTKHEIPSFESELKNTVVRFTRDSKWLILAGEDTKNHVYQVRRYVFRPADLLREAQSRTMRDLDQVDRDHLTR